MAEDRDDRPRRSWREIDQMRDAGRPRAERHPQGEAAEARSRAATQQYVKQIDKLFSKGPSAEASQRVAAVRDAHGSPALVEACRALVAAAGMPTDASLLSLFLDCDDAELVLGALGALRGLAERGELRATPGLRGQLEGLEQGADDAAAEAAEDVMAAL